MAAYPASRRSRRQGRSQDLDITPIMNVFVILVPFLLLTAVFAQTAMVDLNLPTAVDAAEAEELEDTEELNLRIVLSQEGIRIDGNAGSLAPIGLREDGKYDFAALAKTLDDVRAGYPELSTVIVAATPRVRYQDVVFAMDRCKSAGFQGISIGQPD